MTRWGDERSLVTEMQPSYPGERSESGEAHNAVPGFRFANPGYGRWLRAAHDLAHQSDRLLDHRGSNVEMRAGPDPAVHHGEQHAALTQDLDHAFAGNPGAIRVEE